MTNSKLKILGKLHNIMKSAKFIPKDKKNGFHGYSYASEEAIKKTLHPLMVENKVLLQIEALEQRTIKGELKAGGKREDSLTEVTFRYTFYDIESGESLEGQFLGSGADKGDKGLWQAVTGAWKVPIILDT